MEDEVMTAGTAPSSSDPRGLPLAMLLLFVAAFLRCPPLLIHGRMWAEELPIFLIGNWNHTFSFALFAPHFGYFSIWDNALAAVAIHWLPLPEMALLFTWSGVIILLVTGYLVYEAEFLRTRTAKFLGVAAILLSTPSCETWLNVLNSEFYFGIWAAIILLSDASRLRAQRHLALGLAVLSGPLTTLLGPLFVLRAVIGRKRGQLTQAAVVCVGALVQLGYALYSHMANRNPRLVLTPLGPEILIRNYIQDFLGRIPADKVYHRMSAHWHFSLFVVAGCWIGMLVISAALVYLMRRQRISLYILLIAFWFTVLESLLALEGGSLALANPSLGERYAYIPNFLIELALITIAVSYLPGVRRNVARVLLLLAFLSGGVDFLLLPFGDQTYYQGEPWRQQALRWEANSNAPLHAFPTRLPPYHLPPRQ